MAASALTLWQPVRTVRAVFVRGKFAVVVLLVLATGGQWFLLQSLAWVQMTVNYAQTDSFSTALQKTFDGKHPCALCKLVKRGKAAEREHGQTAPQTKFDFHLMTGSCGLVPPRPLRHFTPLLADAVLRAEAPALPPPRPVSRPS